MTNTMKQKIVLAALAGLAVGFTAPQTTNAQDKPVEVSCYGVNGCRANAKCNVSTEDLAAVRKLLGDTDYKARFGKSRAHSCAAHAKCGAKSHILNWTPTSGAACKDQGGILIEGDKGKKVAKKA